MLDVNLGKSKNIKSIKGNTYYISGVISRNKYTNNMYLHNKAKSTIRGSIYNKSFHKIGETSKNKSKPKNIFDITKTKFNEVKPKKEIGYKEINYIKNKNSRNRNEIKRKILNSGNIIDNSRNYKNISKAKNMSQTKTVMNKKKKKPKYFIISIRCIRYNEYKEKFCKRI